MHFPAQNERVKVTNHRALEENECIVWPAILVRWNAQGLNFPTHKDSCQYLAPLLQNIQLKMRNFPKKVHVPDKIYP